MKKDGDGDSELKFFLLPLKAVYEDLFSDERLKGHQFYQFQEYFDHRGVRVFGEPNGSLSFQAAAARIGPEKMPLSIVIYIDGTLVLQHVDVRVIYGKPLFEISLKKFFLIAFTSFD